MWDLRFIGTESSFLQSFLIYDFGGEKYDVRDSGRVGSYTQNIQEKKPIVQSRKAKNYQSGPNAQYVRSAGNPRKKQRAVPEYASPLHLERGRQLAARGEELK